MRCATTTGRAICHSSRATVKTLTLTALRDEITLADVNRVLAQFDVELPTLAKTLPLDLHLARGARRLRARLLRASHRPGGRQHEPGGRAGRPRAHASLSQAEAAWRRLRLTSRTAESATAPPGGALEPGASYGCDRELASLNFRSRNFVRKARIRASGRRFAVAGPSQRRECRARFRLYQVRRTREYQSLVQPMAPEGSGQRDPRIGDGRSAEGELRPSRHADGHGGDRGGAVEPSPAAQPGQPAMGRPRPLRGVEWPRLACCSTRCCISPATSCRSMN